MVAACAADRAPFRRDAMLTIVFDLDGTLVDTAPDLIATLNLILGREGLPALPYEDARAMIGGGARGMIERALKADGRDGTKPELDRMFGAFIEHYAAHIADLSRPFPALEIGAGPACRRRPPPGRLHQQARMAVGTAARNTATDPATSAAICGQDTFGMQKPDPEVLRRTILQSRRRSVAGDHGRQFRHRHPDRPRRCRSGDRRRFRL